ncbi:MAG TPA: fatty acid--CoA ligase family protein [Chthoniobacterales bacterium]
MNIVEHIFRIADRNAVALVGEGQQVTYGKLAEKVDAAAVAIAATSAMRVGLDCPNGIDHVVLALAIVRAGKCLVPLATELVARERDELIRQSHLGAIVSPDGSVREVKQDTHPEFDEEKLASLNPAFIRFSSGTTGKSKGIVLSHERLLERVTAANRGLHVTPSDKIVWILPMAHHFAVSIMLYLVHGATTIIENSHLAEDVLSAGRRYGGTILYGAPFHHGLLSAETSDRDWPGLRLAVSTAAALPLTTAQAFHERYGLPLSQGLGIIECGLTILNLRAHRKKPEAIGRPLPDFEADIREGQLFLRGPGMLDAYLNPWRARAAVLEDGWFRTGDMARQDADGDFFLEGRAHSVINIAGMKCFPEEVEAVLCTHPDIRAARVFGRPHPKTGAIPSAEIVPKDPAEPPKIASVAALCRASLARYKVPIEFKFVDSIPKTANGKIKRG